MAEPRRQAQVLTETAVGDTLAWIRAIEYPEWMVEAACAGSIDNPPDAWFPSAGPGRNPTGRVDKITAATDAKAVCKMCPVRQECLFYALERDERWGVWGGLDQYERRALKAGRSA